MENENIISCEKCLHWYSYSYTQKPKYGTCVLSKSKNPQMGSGCGLRTREDFWCKLFNPKLK